VIEISFGASWLDGDKPDLSGDSPSILGASLYMAFAIELILLKLVAVLLAVRRTAILRS